MENIIELIFALSLFLGLLISVILKEIRKYRYSCINYNHVNEESFQKYAKFYGNTVPKDEKFDIKLNTIYELITKNKESDIKKIADSSDCTLEECVLKIKYLKNKRLLGDYYIDTSNMKLLPCNLEDQKLLDKYKPFIYRSHLQINEIANMISNKGYKNIHELRDEVYKERLLVIMNLFIVLIVVRLMMLKLVVKLDVDIVKL